jgi:hypothetical protein
MTWDRISPRTWEYRRASADLWSYPVAEIECVGFGRWWLYINRRLIAEFKTWDEASGCAPMLIKLHESENNQ